MINTQIPSKWTPEAAFAEFQAKFDELSANSNLAINEADTRLKIINVILFDVLNWHLADVETEKYCRCVGFADYVMKVQDASCLVIEAKRSGSTFTVPAQRFKTDPICFALLEAETKETGEALRQALGYAASLGARYVAITNGYQWLLTVTFVQSQQVSERQVILFDSLQTIKDNFRLFWKCFSQQAISENELMPLFMESRKKPAPPKPCAQIPGYPVPSNRNHFVNELASILRLVWDVLARSEQTKDFLESCYIPPATNEHLITFAKEILRHRLQADNVLQQSAVDEATPTNLHSTIIGYDNEKPFVILGDVGHGKTTFLNHLRLVAARDIFDNYIQLDVNFIDRPDTSDAVSDYIYNEIEDQLYRRYKIDAFNDVIVRGALHGDLIRFRSSSQYKASVSEAERNIAEVNFIQSRQKDKHDYFKTLIRHLKRGQNKSLAIFFDNLDRRDAALQERAFLKASAIARDWQCIVFICLRPTTFYASLKRGLLDSLAPKTFTLGSPDLSLILKRRFQFAEKVALGQINTPILRDALSRKEVCFRLPTVAKFFGCCEFSTIKGTSAIDMLAAISNGNIRILIEIAQRMISSGYLDTVKIVEKIQATGRYFVPNFEAVKTLLYGDYDQYHARSSLFVNLFDCYHADPKEHFIRLLALEYLLRFSELSADRGCGWVPNQDLLTYLECFYFDSATIDRHLCVLADAECIELRHSALDGEVKRDDIKITTRGAFHVSNLATEFQYFDAVTVDTPVLDSSLIGIIRNASTLAERLDRSRKFIDYLRICSVSLHDYEGKVLIEKVLDGQLKECAIVEERARAADLRK